MLLWPATVGGQVFFRRDVHLMWFAQTQAYARAWAEGGWPLWNPLASFGQALLADANNQVLYPFTLLRLLVAEPWTYYTMYAFAHLLIAGLGAAFLASRLGLRPLAAVSAGGLWMASGPLLSVIDTWNQLAGAAWMPWAIAAGLAVASGGVRWALGWASVTALQVLAGAPEAVLLSAAGLAVLVAARTDVAHLRWTALPTARGSARGRGTARAGAVGGAVGAGAGCGAARGPHAASVGGPGALVDPSRQPRPGRVPGPAAPPRPDRRGARAPVRCAGPVPSLGLPGRRLRSPGRGRLEPPLPPDRGDRRRRSPGRSRRHGSPRRALCRPRCARFLRCRRSATPPRRCSWLRSRGACCADSGSRLSPKHGRGGPGG